MFILRLLFYFLYSNSLPARLRGPAKDKARRDAIFFRLVVSLLPFKETLVEMFPMRRETVDSIQIRYLLNKIFNTICLTKDTIANSNLHEDVKLFLTKENNLTQVCIRDNSLKTFETNSEKILCECTTFYNNCKVIKYNKI